MGIEPRSILIESKHTEGNDLKRGFNKDFD